MPAWHNEQECSTSGDMLVVGLSIGTHHGPDGYTLMPRANVATSHRAPEPDRHPRRKLVELIECSSILRTQH